MFRYEPMPPELTYRSRAWYVVDRDRDLWLNDLGTNGPRGHRVFALCVRGRDISFEVETEGVADGAPVDQITTFGHSHQARFAHGIPLQTFPDPEERLALQELAAEALQVFDAGERARLGQTPKNHRVRLSAGDQTVSKLADLGYRDGAPPSGAADG